MTNEIIHNQRVNEKLRDIGIQFLYGPYSSGVSVDEISKEDVVILPAFGAMVKEMAEAMMSNLSQCTVTLGMAMKIKRNSRTNPAAFEPTARNAVVGVGAP